MTMVKLAAASITDALIGRDCGKNANRMAWIRIHVYALKSPFYDGCLCSHVALAPSACATRLHLC